MKFYKGKYARFVVFTIREIQKLIMQKTYCKQEKCEENHQVPVRKKMSDMLHYRLAVLRLNLSPVYFLQILKKFKNNKRYFVALFSSI